MIGAAACGHNGGEGAVKFGVMYNTGVYGVDPDAMIAVARHAEDIGFESFYVPEHIALYPGAAVGAAVFPPATPIADPLECLSFVAAATASSSPSPTCAASPSPPRRSRCTSEGRAAPRPAGPACAATAGSRAAGVTEAERASQVDLVRTTARDAGRDADADALEYTRWGSIDMTAADAEAHAARGTTRLVFGPASTDLNEQREQLSAFAERLKLG